MGVEEFHDRLMLGWESTDIMVDEGEVCFPKPSQQTPTLTTECEEAGWNVHGGQLFSRSWGYALSLSATAASRSRNASACFARSAASSGSPRLDDVGASKVFTPRSVSDESRKKVESFGCWKGSDEEEEAGGSNGLESSASSKGFC